MFLKTRRIFLSFFIAILSMDAIITAIRQDLQDSTDPGTLASFQRFFKEAVHGYGVKVPVVNRIAQKHWKVVNSRNKKEIFGICEELYASHFIEEAFIVSNWIPRMKNQFEPEDFAVFEYWVGTYITNWATCDSFCNHAVGDFIEKYPVFIEDLKHWAQSENRWVRRAAAVSLIVPAKHGKFLKNVIEISDLLLIDKDDMVQKGYGWLLKEASRKNQTVVHDFVVKNRKKMPRTALRYAIELMPRELKTEAMKKDW
jgi:3-methyladenine DNA glycosylase AlkD